MQALGWDSLDILLLSGDAYVDHPSFGSALLGRWLVRHGFRVGIAAQPAWENADAAVERLREMGRPRLFAGVTAGAIDSMLAHYTAFRKKRHDDAYTPGGKAGARPNRACIAYTGLVRRAFPGIPVILGGIEASLRRAVHYDFWSDSLRRPLLQDSKADLLVYGMGEAGLLAIARAASKLVSDVSNSRGGEQNENISRARLQEVCRDTPGIAWMDSETAVAAWRKGRERDISIAGNTDVDTASPRTARTNNGTFAALPSYEEILAEPQLLMQATLAIEKQVHQQNSHCLQKSGNRVLVLNPPAPALSETELDLLYSLPYTRLPHPSYSAPIPAWEMIRTSITTHRGCGGGCSFCSLALHQGRHIASRSRASIMDEAGRIAAGPDIAASTLGKSASNTGTPQASGAKVPRWAGSISDVGGPSANMWQAKCTLPEEKQCNRSSCMHPAICPFFSVDQGKGVSLLRGIAALPGIRHVRVASGVRFDLAIRDNDALYAYTSEFTGGQLKVAPEHADDAVLKLMRKPPLRVFEQFLQQFSASCHQSKKELYTVPYLMSAFPGCTEEHMRVLAGWLKAKSWSPQQVQCFIPTPGTVATAMFFSGVDPDGKALYIARSDRERMRQHHILLGNQDGSRRDKKERAGLHPGRVRKRAGKNNAHSHTANIADKVTAKDRKANFSKNQKKP